LKVLEERILKDGYVLGEDILKVDRFLNHQVDVKLLNEVGKAFYEKFKDKGINKIVTIEASGIAIAAITAQYFDVPVVFAKKFESVNADPDSYETNVYSFTKKREYLVRVSKKFICPTDRVLLIDDFLAQGRAAAGLIDLVRQGGGEVVGVGIVIEKSFQEGAAYVSALGAEVYSLARIHAFVDGRPVFETPVV
jgi:xanthine phosphoribosyltransferase